MAGEARTKKGYLKCRFCDFETPRFRKLKGSKSITGPEAAFGRLLGHIEREHRAEWPEIERQLEEIAADCEVREALPSFS